MAAAANELRGVQRGDSVFRGVVRAGSWSMIVLLAGVIVLLFIYSQPTIEKYGFSFLISSDWNPVAQDFGAAPYIFGTI
ncbi:MAG: phosphate ABC transporter permease PstC, partial [Anaerolineae bacterium]|nr:phosphate ABC transporter permease PstC [Anaerolineae bacterium]